MHKDWRVPRAPSDFKEAEPCHNKAHGEALPSKDSSKERSDRKDIVGPAGERPMAGNTYEFNNTSEQKIALFDVNEPLRVDSPVMVEHKETVGTNGAKLKSIQKSVREENIKEPQTLLKVFAPNLYFSEATIFRDVVHGLCLCLNLWFFCANRNPLPVCQKISVRHVPKEQFWREHFWTWRKEWLNVSDFQL
jgi:hypothetical protein